MSVLVDVVVDIDLLCPDLLRAGVTEEFTDKIKWVTSFLDQLLHDADFGYQRINIFPDAFGEITLVGHVVNPQPIVSAKALNDIVTAADWDQAVQSPPVTLPAASRIGPYEIRSALGARGMGQVYRARDARQNRDVALKLLPDAFTADADWLARFEREAKTLASLNHSNIATSTTPARPTPALRISR